MGSVYAVLLAKAGHEIWAIDKWKEHIKAIRTLGLRLEGASGDNTETSIQATTDISKAGACDLYIIATKADGVADAALAISQIMKKDSLILTIQNGLGAGERIAQYISTDNVLLGVAEGFGASIKSPGHAHHNSMRQIRLGEMDGGLTERLKSVEEIWKNAGFNANAFSDIHQLIWEKYICNVFVSAPCTVFDCTIGELIGHLPYREIALGCMREAFRAGKAKGINFSFEHRLWTPDPEPRPPTPTEGGCGGCILAVGATRSGLGRLEATRTADIFFWISRFFSGSGM